MGRRSYASSAKLSFSAIEELRQIKNADRDTFEAMAQQHGVHLETVRRAYKGLTWQRPFVKKLEDEWRDCAVCDAAFCRRRRGRLMTMRLWKDKTTCSQKCLVALKRNRGHAHPFDHSSTRSVIPLHSIIEADGDLREDPDERLEG